MNYLLLPVAIIFAGFGDMVNAFTCQQEGVFKNTDTNDCKSYVVCSSDLTPLVQNCPTNTFFWPNGKGCFSNYNCGTSSMLNNLDPCDGFAYRNIPDKSVTNCSKYLYCLSTNVYNNGYSVNVPQVESYTCPSGTIFNMNNGECVNVSTNQCSNYQCTAEGIFENTNANSCSSYIECSRIRSWQSTASFWYAHIKTCQSGTKFSPFTMKCDAFYNCDGVDQYNGDDPCAEFNEANPFVPNPFDANGASYIECSDNDNLVTILRKVCPANFYFSSLLGKCYNNYDPNETCSKDPCSSGNGRYVDYKSGMCENFIECRDESNDRWSYKPVYEKIYCPPGQRYSPKLKECSKQYTCPTFPVNYCYPQIPTTTTFIPTTPPPTFGK